MAEPLRLPAQAYVYVIGDVSGPQKVGVARDPKQRLALFRTGNTGDLVITVAVPVSRDLAREAERYAHWLLREHHARGEWFSVSPKQAKRAVEDAVAAVLAEKRAPKHQIGGAGRKPLGVKETKIRLPIGLPERIDALVGENRRAIFIREVLEAEVERQERALTATKKPAAG